MLTTKFNNTFLNISSITRDTVNLEKMSFIFVISGKTDTSLQILSQFGESNQKIKFLTNFSTKIVSQIWEKIRFPLNWLNFGGKFHFYRWSRIWNSFFFCKMTVSKVIDEIFTKVLLNLVVSTFEHQTKGPGLRDRVNFISVLTQWEGEELIFTSRITIHHASLT